MRQLAVATVLPSGIIWVHLLVTTFLGVEYSEISVWAVLISLFIYLAKKYPNVLKLGKMKYPMALYLSSITLHGLLGLVSAIFIGTTPLIVMGIGSVSFMISDYILTLDRFVIPKRKWLIRCNSLTYFVGLLLIVLSLGL